MTQIKIRDDKAALLVQGLRAPGGSIVLTPCELSISESVQLARDLMDAVTQCGFELKMTVDVPRHQPTDMQIATAITRVGHLRRDLDGQAPWNDVKTNTEIVMRVLGACL